MKTTSQNSIVKRHIRRRYLDSWEAIELYGITRLSARIDDLERQGCIIKTKRAPNSRLTAYKLL